MKLRHHQKSFNIRIYLPTQTFLTSNNISLHETLPTLDVSQHQISTHNTKFFQHPNLTKQNSHNTGCLSTSNFNPQYKIFSTSKSHKTKLSHHWMSINIKFSPATQFCFQYYQHITAQNSHNNGCLPTLNLHPSLKKSTFTNISQHETLATLDVSQH